MEDFFENIAEAGKGFAKQKLTKLLLPFAGWILLIGFLIIVSIVPIASMRDSFEGAIKKDHPDISEDDLAKMSNDPEEMLKIIKLKEFDPKNLGYYYICEEDFKNILQSVVDYQKSQKRERDVQYTYYEHQHVNHEERIPSQEENTLPSTIIVNTCVLKSDTQGPRDIHLKSIENDPEFSVFWQEVYAMALIKAACDQDMWKDVMEEASDEKGKKDLSVIKPELRISTQDIETIIQTMEYQFSYYFDPTLPQESGRYEYKDMENHAFRHIKSMAQDGCDCGDENPCHDGCTAIQSLYEFDYVEEKIPAIAPATAMNAYKMVIWNYDDDKVLESRTITVDADAFMSFGESLVGEEFDIEWFVFIMESLPGIYNTTEGQEALSVYRSLLDASNGNGDITTTRNELDVEGKGEIKLGKNVTIFDPPEFGWGSGPVSNPALSDEELEKLIKDLPPGSGTEVVKYALQFVGCPYVWGGEDPLNGGADCSGFTMYVYRHFGITLPHYAAAQANCGVRINGLANAKPGDLLIRISRDSDGKPSNHVVIYMGDGRIVHASNKKPYPQGGIKTGNVYFEPTYIVRLVN